MPAIPTWQLLLRDNGGEYEVEATYRSPNRPRQGVGPYLSQEGFVFTVEDDDGGDVIYGRRSIPSG